MKDKKSGECRRKLLKSIAAGTGAVAAGSAIPTKWSKPLVDSVVLPAHAQTTCPSCTGVTKTEEDNSTIVVTLIDGTLIEGTLGFDWGDGVIEIPVKDSVFSLNQPQGCNGFVKISGPISRGSISGDFEWSNGVIEDGDQLYWGSGTFSGDVTGTNEWTAQATGTESHCTAA